jgi:hypothetical protein
MTGAHARSATLKVIPRDADKLVHGTAKEKQT